MSSKPLSTVRQSFGGSIIQPSDQVDHETYGLTKRRRLLGGRLSERYDETETPEVEIEFSPPSGDPPPPSDPPDEIYRDWTGREISYEEWLRLQEELRRRKDDETRWWMLQREHEAIRTQLLAAQEEAKRKRDEDAKRRSRLSESMMDPDAIMKAYNDSLMDLPPDAPSDLGELTEAEILQLNLNVADDILTRTMSTRVIDKTTKLDWQIGATISDEEKEIRKKINRVKGGGKYSSVIDRMRSKLPKELFDELIEALNELDAEAIVIFLQALEKLLEALEKLGYLKVDKQILRKLPILRLFANLIHKAKDANYYKDDKKRLVRDLVNIFLSEFLDLWHTEVKKKQKDGTWKAEEPEDFDLWNHWLTEWMVKAGKDYEEGVLDIIEWTVEAALDTIRGFRLKPKMPLPFIFLR